MRFYGVSKENLLIVLLPFFGVIPAMLILWLSISPMLQKYLFGNTATPMELLQGYERWYQCILIGACLCAGMMICFCAIQIVLFVRKRDELYIGDIARGAVLNFVCLALGVGVVAAMYFMEDLGTLPTLVKEDIAQLENGQTESAEIWISPKRIANGSLPGPFAGEEVEVVTEFRGLEIGEGGNWDEFYLPLSLGVELDTNTHFDENYSIDWNKENSCRYLVKYTSNFRLITEIEQICP